jgi:signal peptidase II
MRFWGPYSLLALSVGAGAALIDQLYKAWMIGVFDSETVRKFTLTPFFDVVMVWNRGISYGLFKQDSDAGRWALVAFSLVAVVILAVWAGRLHSRLAAAGLGLIAGGALGNAIDRIRFGAVADFFSFHVGSFNWYVFNLADVAIVLGVMWLLLDSLLVGHKSAEKQA